MAKPNYSFAKRQREIAKKQKKEEKRLRKAGTEGAGAEGAPESVAQAPASVNESAPLSRPDDTPAS